MSAFHPIATQQQTQFYVGLVPGGDIPQRSISIAASPAFPHSATRARSKPRSAVAAAPPPVSAGHVKKPDLLACDLLNARIASGVGCNSTLQPFFAK